MLTIAVGICACDPRFSAQNSVPKNAIWAVACLRCWINIDVPSRQACNLHCGRSRPEWPVQLAQAVKAWVCDHKTRIDPEGVVHSCRVIALMSTHPRPAQTSVPFAASARMNGPYRAGSCHKTPFPGFHIGLTERA